MIAGDTKWMLREVLSFPAERCRAEWDFENFQSGNLFGRYGVGQIYREFLYDNDKIEN